MLNMSYGESQTESNHKQNNPPPNFTRAVSEVSEKLLGDTYFFGGLRFRVAKQDSAATFDNQCSAVSLGRLVGRRF